MDETTAASEAKRRKIRKGTRSCWECKRRKMKCMFEGSPAEADECIGCKKRGTKCVSQEFDYCRESLAPSKKQRGQKTGDHDRVMRVEALLEQLIKKSGSEETTNGWNSNHGIPTPASIHSDSSRPALSTPAEYYGFEKDSKNERLSRCLYESLPSLEDVQIICKARSAFAILSHEMLSIPYTALEQGGLQSPDSLLEIPGPNVDPVLIARYMLQLATFLQFLHPNLKEETKHLSESPQEMIKRLADTAIGLVTTNDELLGSIEGLECVMMESMYQSNCGNLRRSWVAVRRALVIAQLMGLHRSGSLSQYKVLDPKTKAHPQFMWFRINFYDRHLCLMLGLPQGSLDHSMASDAMLANDTPMGRLERMHCVLASRILERNEFEPSCLDFALTQDLDMGLQRAAKNLPNKWWLTPTLDNAGSPEDLILEKGRIVNQLFHYNLLNQLHLPFMLRSSAERRYDYSRMTCVTASREVLSRFLSFRNDSRSTFSCRIMEFFALMAAMTLLLAHLDGHRAPQIDNFLAHQSLSDRAMIEKVQENMKDRSGLDSDALSEQSAYLLRQMLKIGDGNKHGAKSVSVQTPETEIGQSDEENDSAVRVYVPYFGIIKIAREGVISKEIPNPQSSVASDKQTRPAQLVRPSASSPETAHAEAATAAPASICASLSRSCDTGLIEPVAGYDCLEDHSAILQPLCHAFVATQAQPTEVVVQSPHDASVGTHFAPQLPRTISDRLLQQYEYPVLTAGIEDWAFQGVDTAFFNSLMRGVEDDGNANTEWAAWQNGSEH